MANEKRIDQPTGTEFVGHEWDGIEELDTPMPRWWVWTFYATIVWALVYVVLYPAWPLVEKGTEGVLGWTSRGQLASEISAADKARAGTLAKIAAADFATLSPDDPLWQMARAGGAAAYKVNCSQCHGSGAAGSQQLGYPNLNDDDWLWGGDLAAIEYTITHGIRQPEEYQRQSVMPPFAGAFDAAQLAALVQHVRSLSGLDKANAQGAQMFADNCAACHGANGQGDRTIGAPRLSDAIWLRGSSAEAIKAQILNPKMGAMPAWGKRLDPATVKMLTAYIHSLGGGEKPVPVATPTPAAPASETDGEQ